MNRIKPENFRNIGSLGMRGYYIVVFNEINAYKRNIGMIIKQFNLPLMYFLFLILGINNSIGNVSYKGINLLYAEYALIGIFALLITSLLTQIIYRTTIDKRFGMLALKIQSGVKPLIYIMGMSTFPIMCFLLQTTILYVISIVMGFGFTFINFYLAVLLGVICLLFWTSLGIFITMFINDYQKRDIILSFIITPLGFTAPSFYVSKSVPDFIYTISLFNPLTYQLDALRGIAFGVYEWKPIVIVFVLTIISVAFVSVMLSKIKLVTSEK